MRVYWLPILVAMLFLIVAGSVEANHPVPSPLIYDTFRSFDGGYHPSNGYFVNRDSPVSSCWRNRSTRCGRTRR